MPSLPISAARTNWAATSEAFWYFSWGRSTWPEMISGVRASSIRIESTSSMTQ